MKRDFSIYLDLVRFVAALLVFLEHLQSQPFTKQVLWDGFGYYGTVAVIGFFVLSGFVIAHVIAHKETTPSEYFSSRVARMYSVVVVALVVTFVLDWIGQNFNPSLYLNPKVMVKPESWQGYLSSLFFVNEYRIFGFHGIAPGTNGPYWSLSFEVTYYVIAGLVLFAPRQWSWGVSLAILILAGPTIAVLFPTWVLGFLLYRWQDRVRWNRRVSLVLFWTSLVGFFAVPVLARCLPSNNFGIYLPWGRGPFNRNVIQDVLTALFFGCHLLAAIKVMDRDDFFRGPWECVIRWAGSLTFPFYCLHFPLLCCLAALSPWENTSWMNILYLTAGCFTMVAVLNPVFRLLKSRFKSASLGLFKKLERHPRG